ncbi:FAD/NAD(P)-binding domain-containing protein [Calocera cornea HHB12733]|uniref:FAD/NAD(P)-binding domain-containing protein n=1 Tax=Calocera cornea HHB12733 TaxID=1353952 RepID=A0A165D4S5_9BASI|nr:FAD/NAD(P)-binding domain-containing protein [Calocera cornea HHB12733]
MKIIIIGAGIGGPLLALLLKHKGFEPVVYERHNSIPSSGLAVSLSAQGFKVLNIMGLAEEAMSLGVQSERMVHRSQITGKVLQDVDSQSTVRKMTGWPSSITLRSKLCQWLADKMVARGIPIHWGKKFVDLKQVGEKVTANFEDGTSVEGDLLVGCDGIHSKVRDALFGPTPAEYTGLVAIGGFTPYTEELHPTRPLTTNQVSGNGCHFICMPTAEDKYFWAVSVPEEAEMLEDWRTAQPTQVSEMLGSLPASKWEGDTGKIINASESVIKFGLYLRPVPQVWHKGRVVLLGDAAHPITPFLGQGANVSTEDVYHLVRVLVQHAPLTDDSLDKAFKEYTAIRLPKATKVVEQSRRETENRKVLSDEAIKARDEMRAKGLNSDVWKLMMEMLQGPFTGESEI